MNVKDESRLTEDMVLQIKELPTIFKQIEEKLLSQNIKDGIVLYQYFSKLHTEKEVKLVVLEKATLEGDFSISEKLENKYSTYQNFNFTDQLDISSMKFEETLLSDSRNRNLLLNDLTELDSFITQRMIEISVKDYSSFALSWNSKEAESFI